jgi:tetratricopeptide (TPR) repeat protein
MATTKISKKDMQQDEFIETVFDLGDWLEAHWRRVAMAAGAVVAVIVIGYAWFAWQESRSLEANDILAQGMQAFSPAPGADGKAPSPDYAKALTLFEQAAAKAGSQPVGLVAQLYRGRTLIAMGRASEATPVLDAVASSGNARLAAQAKVSQAEAAAAAKDYDRAATLLQGLAAATDGAFPPDAALMLLAGVREQQGKRGEAKKTYDDIVARFPQSAFAGEARQRSTDLASSR